MTEAEFWQLLKRLWGKNVPLNPTQRAALLESIRARMSEGSARSFEEVLRSLKPPTKPPWWKRVFSPKNLRIAGYAALFYLLVAAIYDANVDPPTISSGTGICNTAAGTVAVAANPSRPGPNTALRAAMEQIATQCNAAALACTSVTCPTCGPDPAVQSVVIKNRLFWYTAEVTATCQCWCL